jgi:hypothetical protein
LKFTEIKCFEIGLCDGKNQLLQFWSERFMPNAFENPEGLSFENVGILLVGLRISIYESLFLSLKKLSMIFFE